MSKVCHKWDSHGQEKILDILHTTQMHHELPKSLLLYNTSTANHLEKHFWNEINTDYKLLEPTVEELQRPLTSYPHDVLHELLQMTSEWRQEARSQAARMSNEEHWDLISTCIPGYREFRESLKRKSPPYAPPQQVSPDASCESNSPASRAGRPTQNAATPSSNTRTRKQKPGLRAQGYLYNKKTAIRSTHRRGYPMARSRRPRAFGSAPLRRKVNSDLKDEDASDDHGMSEKLNYSSKPANLRSSLRKPSPPRRVPPKLARLWKSLVKKVVCKFARQRITWRRDKILTARKAARECAKVIRQRALLSQKAARDSLSRGHRIAREIAQNWRSSAFQAANGSTTAMVINGVPIPCTGIAYRNLHRTTSGPNATSLVKSSDGEVTSTPMEPFTESAAAARRRAERAAAEQRKADRELLEARRQQRKLNFLLTQTELYAHFMSKKLDGNEPEGANNGDHHCSTSVGLSSVAAGETARILRRLEDSDESDDEVDDPWTTESSRTKVDAEGDVLCKDANVLKVQSEALATTSLSRSSIAAAARAAAHRLGLPGDSEYDIDSLKSEALSKVKIAIEKENIRKSSLHLPRLVANGEIDQPGAVPPGIIPQTKAPRLFTGELKAYQLRGLNWLSSLFDQGINGILADEMGLGKTIQTIAFLGHLAEVYDIWGPFLIVTPSSTLHNWTQEFSKFLPAFRLVPYWGSPAERKVLRRFWSSSSKSHVNGGGSQTLDGRRDSEMHVVVTSYQVVLQDSRFISRTAWAYIVLDEAHAIKSTASLRWKILLSFNCRNRLLLTGTPIQNTMQELWALLHFIMPTLFDSHDEFATWFSRDIESHAAASSSVSAGTGSGFSTSRLDENQLSRLRLILKPFMLRRTKLEVQHEISTKTEIMLYCPLSTRQQRLYNRLRNKIRLEDLSSMIRPPGSSELSSADSSAISGPASTAHLINLVMQLRKVCNHPDLWEHRGVTFSCISGGINPSGASQPGFSSGRHAGVYTVLSPTSTTCYSFPRLLFEQGLLCGITWQNVGNMCPVDRLAVGPSLDRLATVLRYFIIFEASYIHADLWHHDAVEPDLGPRNSVSDCHVDRTTQVSDKCFSFSRLIGLTVGDLTKAFRSIGSLLSIRIKEPTKPWHWCADDDYAPSANWVYQDRIVNLHPTLPEIQCISQSQSDLPPFVLNAIVPKILLAPVQLFVRRPNFPRSTERAFSVNYLLASWRSLTDGRRLELPKPQAKLELVSMTTRIADSGKLTTLDTLLSDLKSRDHRVLIYSQMTRMIDILEEFMVYRQHAYLRLDGSSRLSDRRDMVAQWQTNPRWFAFLLSTRAGGLGINLTAADTVIFYDSDWNPTVDQQAMDRAHRLGQTKPVTVYRLICKNTIEGRMLQRAEEKRAMQAMVIQSGKDALRQLKVKPGSEQQLTSTDVVSLLLDDDEVVTRLQVRRRLHASRGRQQHWSQTTGEEGQPVDSSSATEGQGMVAPATGCSQTPLLCHGASSPAMQHALSNPASGGNQVLERKRQAAWANLPKGGFGRPKKIRALEPITPVVGNGTGSK